MSTRARLTLLSILPCLFLTSSCGLGDAVDEAAKAIDDAISSIDEAINALEAESGNWQQVIQELRGDVGNSIDGLDARLNAIVQRAIGTAGVEARCTVDFLGRRAIQSLHHIRAWLLDEPLPSFSPTFCQAVPSGVERQLVQNGTVNQLELYGYDFDGKTVLDVAEGASGDPLRVFLRSSSGQEVDVSQYLDRPTHYLFTLNLGGNGVRLNDNSARLMFRWNNSLIGSVAVIQPVTPVCQERIRLFNVGQVTVVPTRQGSGDREFDGNGPRVDISARVFQNGNRIQARLNMVATETKSDWTRGSGSNTVNVGQPDPGFRIDQILTPTFRSLNYTDDDHGTDDFRYGSGDVVQWIKVVGDTGGDDIGSGTQATALFNPVRVHMIQNADCVTEVDVQRLITSGLLTDAARVRLQPQRLEIRESVRTQVLDLNNSN